jgi:YgbB-like protein
MSQTMRIGCGYDIHALAPGRSLILGGVDIPHSKGLLGHSDSDALVHAVCDALLGAMGEGDLGRKRGFGHHCASAEARAALGGYAKKYCGRFAVGSGPRECESKKRRRSGRRRAGRGDRGAGGLFDCCSGIVVR